MSVRYGAAIGLMILAFGSNAVSRAASAQNGSDGDFGAFDAKTGAEGIATRMLRQEQDYRRQAPIGHRQPRPNDIHGNPEVSPLERELRHEDESVDKKLIICRDC
jgi:hypothetical protein